MTTYELYLNDASLSYVIDVCIYCKDYNGCSIHYPELYM